MFAYGTLKNIFKVIYAPRKAFNEIAQNPKYIGPILIMILFVAAYTGGAYVAQNKICDEQTLPTIGQGDEWTENITRASWTSNAVITESYDSIGQNKSADPSLLIFNFYGSESLEFSAVNSTQMWMQLNFSEPLDCLGSDGYLKISFWLKLIHLNINKVDNASLYLFSSQTDYFQYNLTKQFASFNITTWNKLIIPIELGSEWTSNNASADGNSIISLKFGFVLTENVNATVRLDGLFFKGPFKPLIENTGLTYMLSYSLYLASTQFVITWVFLGGLIYIMTKAFGGKTIWRPSLILIGFALITMFVQASITAVAYSTLPTIHRQLEFFSAVEQERLTPRNEFSEEVWLVSQVVGYLPLIVLVWTITLCAIALRLLTKFSWSKSFLIVVVAYFATMIAQDFILRF